MSPKSFSEVEVMRKMAIQDGLKEKVAELLHGILENLTVVIGLMITEINNEN